MREQEIRDDFAKAFDQVENGADLSGQLGFGFSDQDLANLAKLHRDQPKYRQKIYDLLEDCNFHTANSDFEEGRYDEYLKTDGAIPFSVDIQVATSYLMDLAVSGRSYDIKSSIFNFLSDDPQAKDMIREAIRSRYGELGDPQGVLDQIFEYPEAFKELIEYRSYFPCAEGSDQFTATFRVQCLFLTNEFEQRYGFTKIEDAEEGREL